MPPRPPGCGRGSRISADVEPCAFVDELVDAAILHPAIHRPASSAQGYRNRMTYTLRQGADSLAGQGSRSSGHCAAPVPGSSDAEGVEEELRQFSALHPLARPEVNALAVWVLRWVRAESRLPELYDEMTVKLTRRAQLMLTLAIALPPPSSPSPPSPSAAGAEAESDRVRERLEAEDLRRLAAALRQHWPSVASAGYWLCARELGYRAPRGPFTPGCPPPYSIFLGTERVVEEVPPVRPGRPPLPYAISHGTFSEINHAMESLIFPTVAGWCRRPLQPPWDSSSSLLTPPPLRGSPHHRRRQLSKNAAEEVDDGRDAAAAAAAGGGDKMAARGGATLDLLVTGRDTNALSLGLGLVAGPWGRIHAVSHCHLVVNDCAFNARQPMYAELPLQPLQVDKAATAAFITGLSSPPGCDGAADDGHHGRRPVVVVSSAGRHGLRPEIIAAMRRQPRIVRVVYDSCNPVSLRRDLARFLSGGEDGGFCLEDMRSFDFFPSTPYMVTICALVRRPRTLVCPLGPCGVGKSTLSRRLQQGATQRAIRVFERDRAFATNRGLGLQPLMHCDPSNGHGSEGGGDDAVDADDAVHDDRPVVAPGAAVVERGDEAAAAAAAGRLRPHAVVERWGERELLRCVQPPPRPAQRLLSGSLLGQRGALPALSSTNASHQAARACVGRLRAQRRAGPGAPAGHAHARRA